MSNEQAKYLSRSIGPFDFKIGDILKKGTIIEIDDGTYILPYTMKVSSMPGATGCPQVYQANLRPLTDEEKRERDAS